MEPIRKIVAIGPESTGKSSLCRSLAMHYDGLWCPEYARQYLEEKGPDYRASDLVNIAQGQLQLEDLYTQKAKARKDAFLFIDTNLYVVKIWSEYAYGKCHHLILDAIANRPYDLYLLCHTDLPWTPDPLREYPDPRARQELFLMYKDLLIAQSIPFVDIQGADDQRVAPAIQAIEQRFVRP